MRARNDPDFIQELHSLVVHIQVVQIQSGQLQLHVVKLEIREVGFPFLQQNGRISHPIPGNNLFDPSKRGYRFVRLDVHTAVVHALHGQISIQCLDRTLVEPSA